MNFTKENIKLLACPICKKEFTTEITQISGNEIISGDLKCNFCQKEFKIIKGIPNLIPLDFLNNKKHKEWEEKQEHGLEDYESPDKNYQDFIKLTSRMFGTFCQHHGTVLDIGCGIAPQLNYFNKEIYKDVNFIGIDPLIEKQNREYFFIQGVGEYLPIRNNIIDQIIISTTLDHVVDPLPILKEAKRVLKRDGEINIWISVFDPISKRRIDLFRKALSLIRRGDFRKLISGAKRNITEDTFFNPGDKYHFQHFTKEEIFSLLNKLDIRIVRCILLDEGDRYLFLKAKK